MRKDVAFRAPQTHPRFLENKKGGATGGSKKYKSWGRESIGKALRDSVGRTILTLWKIVTKLFPGYYGSVTIPSLASTCRRGGAKTVGPTVDSKMSDGRPLEISGNVLGLFSNSGEAILPMRVRAIPGIFRPKPSATDSGFFYFILGN
jgi:hypothetical protein